MPDLTEKRLESEIEQFLLSPEGGYIPGNAAYYDRERAVDISQMMAFINNTQPREWERYQRNYLADAEKMLYKRFQEEVEAKGLIHVLRYGVKDRGITLRFAYFEPASGLNEDLTQRYRRNILSCYRQFAYSRENTNTIDMVLSLNGIPIIALELKNQFTGQSVEDGKKQFMLDRDPREPLFRFNRRILVYFTADLTEVWMATALKGTGTRFLPFNRGSSGAGNVGGAGNPPWEDRFVTGYLWEDVLRWDSLLALLQRYISLETKETVIEKDGQREKKITQAILFPRYHQLDVVEKLVADAQARGSGKNYLIQHSAGSGKSNSIAWLTYRLATLHDAEDREVFNSVFVVTDRRVLNRQLQDTIMGFEHQDGMIVTIKDDTPSTALSDAIRDKRRIVITTLHRFPIICKEVDAQHGRRFAVIVDEAHSSQSGTSARKLKETLADTAEALKEFAEIEGKTEEELLDGEDLLVKELLTHGQHGNLSFFAFTATPKPKTLEAFGEKQPDGRFQAFHIYSMRQAIEEGFILDVLRYYTTLNNSFEIIRAIKDNPEMTEIPTMAAIRRYQKGHGDTIEKKVAVMAEKFREVTLAKLDGKAKAMLVTASRAHAVKYYIALRQYAKEKGYADIRPMVAFSGKLTIGDTEYTESDLNSECGSHITESQVPEYFASDAYNFLVVADKYQTGFDEPRLHTMFVDKRLHGVKAVQTLSRVNRSHPGKIDTYILDFANTAEEIKQSFLPFYEDTQLKEKIEVNLVYKYKDAIEAFCLWNAADTDRFCDVYLRQRQESRDMGRLAGIIKPAADRYNQMPPDTRYRVRDAVRGFNRCYSYVVQVARMFDRDTHKFYLFSEYFQRLIPNEPREIIDIDKKIRLDKNLLSETFSGSIGLAPKPEDKVLKQDSGGKGSKKPDKKELLENIIEKINILFEGKFTDADRVIVEILYDRLASQSKTLAKFAKSTDADMFAWSIFPEEFDKAARECYTQQTDSFTKLFENKEFYKKVMEQMARVMYMSMRSGKDVEAT
jgi:type I restriction enzyme, R subunit